MTVVLVMTPTRGPTKKLAPAISPERCCPHEWSEDEGLQLEIDCSSCAGGNSLANSKCLSGILKALTTGGLPETIVLKSYIHKRYRGDAVGSAAAVASELAGLNRALVSASLDRPSEKKCRTCRASRENLLAMLRRSILDDPAFYASDRTLFLARVRGEIAPTDCTRVDECVAKGLATASFGQGANP